MKIASKERRERGKRGPREGDGGRPRYKLYEDPDRWIVIAALWYSRSDPKEQMGIAHLQALDNLLTKYEKIELALGALPIEERLRGGIEHRSLSIANTEPPLKVATNSPARRPLSAPGGMTARRSRLQGLQFKVQQWQRARLNKSEELWKGLCHLALDFMAMGEPDKALPLLAKVGWDLPEAARKRLAEILPADIGCRPTVLQPI
jgi:hypothetical protein